MIARVAFYISAISVALLVRQWFWDIETYDWLYFFQHYLGSMRATGGLEALGDRYGNSSPAVTLFLTVVSYSPFLYLYTLKFAYFLFEVATAALGARIVARYHKNAPHAPAAITFATLLFLPSIIFNGSGWAQNDCTYSFFLVLTVFIATSSRIRRRTECWGELAGLAFGAALAFKLQSVFFSVAFFFILLHAPHRFRTALAVPVPYFVACVPLLLAGRPISSLWNIYVAQSKANDGLVFGAPTVYSVLPPLPEFPTVYIGTALAIVVVGLVCEFLRRNAHFLWTTPMLQVSLLSCLLIPFILPKMHERYFYPAELFAVILAVCVPRFAPFAIILCAISALGYTPYLFGLPLVPTPVRGIIMGCLVIWLMMDLHSEVTKRRTL